MNEMEFVRKVVTVFEGLGIPYFITGGLAAIAYGEPRYTSDLDIVAELPVAKIPDLLAQFPAPEFYLSEQAVRDAVARRFQFNILHLTSSNKVDVMIPSTSEYDQLRFSRKTQLDIDKTLKAHFASPEDVILKKLEYFQIGGSEKHLRDIASMLLIRGDGINREYIEEWAGRLGISAEWQMMCDRLKESAD